MPVVPEPGSLREPVRRGGPAPAGGGAGPPGPAARHGRGAGGPPRAGTSRPAGAPPARRAGGPRRPVPRASGPPRRYRDDGGGALRRSRVDVGRRYSAPPQRRPEPEEPWDSPRRWESEPMRPVSGGPDLRGPDLGRPDLRPARSPPRRAAAAAGTAPRTTCRRSRTTGGRRPGTSPRTLPVDDTPTLVDLASRRARRAAGESRSARRRRASADAVDGAYWAGLRGEAK